VRDEQVRQFSDADRSRLAVVLGASTPRYLTVAEAAHASGFSRRAVYRAIDRGELRASLVCSRFRIHPDDFLAWVEGERAAVRGKSAPVARVGVSKAPTADGLRSLLNERETAA
jgi:excisionase family DNA binding protein